MKPRIGYIQSAFDKTWKPIESVDHFDKITGDKKVFETISKIRAARGKMATEEYRTYKNNLKRSLPAFIFMGCSPDGMEGHRVKLVPTGLGMIDIDTENEKGESIYMRYMEKNGDPSKGATLEGMKPLLVHTTPSGTGLRIIFLMGDKTLHYLQSVLTTQGFAIDAACKDITRLSYACRGADVLYMNEELFNLPEMETKPAAQPAAAEDAIRAAAQVQAPAQGGKEYPKEYDGIPYAKICEVLVGLVAGGDPNHGNRNTTIYTMARHLRHICDNDPLWIEQILPNYGEAQSKVHTSIISACNSPRTQNMSYQLKRAIAMCKEEKSITEVEEKSPSAQPPVMPKLPKVLAVMMSRVPKYARPSCALSVFPALATLQANVKSDYIDGKLTELGMMHLQIGETASGKSFAHDPINHLLLPIMQRDEAARAAEQAWREKIAALGNSKDKPQRPDMPIQWLSSNITPAAFTDRQISLNEHGRLYAFTMHPELETIRNIASGGNGSALAVAQIIKNAYDNSNEGQDRRSADAVSGKCPLRWNFLASTTPVQAQRFFAKQMQTDGTLNRISFSCLFPSGEGIPKAGYYDEQYDEDIKPYTDNLIRVPAITHDIDDVYKWEEEYDEKNDITIRQRVLKDENVPFVIKTNDGYFHVHCPEALALCKRLVTKYEELATDTGSIALNNFSLRGAHKAFKRAILLYIANGYKWDDTFDAWLEWAMNFDIWSVMQHFGDSVESQLQSERAASCKAGRVNTLDLVPDKFTKEDLIVASRKLGYMPNKQQIQNRIYQWKRRGLIKDEAGGYTKIKSDN